MSSHLEQIVTFSVTSILVTLFTWIYLRDRQQRIGLWMIGWIAIFVHFTNELAWSYSLVSSQWYFLVKAATLEIAGVSFVVSMSKVYASTRARILYFGLVGLPSVIYLALMVWGPKQSLIYPSLLLLSIASVVAYSWRYYSLKNLYFYVLLVAPSVYAIWAATRAAQKPSIGLHYYLATFFGVAGVLYWRHYHRVTPGVITTSVAFLAWGGVFPLAYTLSIYHIFPIPTAMWDLPKYFVAVGMILTLFENQATLATSAARQYQALFEGNMAGVYVSTLEGQMLDCNAAFVSMFGFQSKQELLPKSGTLFCADPADYEHFFHELQRDGRILNRECRKLRQDGTQLWVLEGATIFSDSSGRKLIEGTAIDITERKQAELALKQSEERFSTIFRHSPAGCGIVSVEGVFLDVNEALLNMFGLPAEQVIGKTGGPVEIAGGT